MKKKLLSVNIGSKGFRDEYDKACSELGLSSTTVRSRNCCFVLSGKDVTLFHKNTEVTPEEYGYVFVRVAGNFTLMASLLTQYFNTHQVPISDPTYLEHTENEEKITQMLLFTLHGVAIPPTILFTIKGFAENSDIILKTVSFPCVLKTNGSKGSKVWKVEDKEELEQKLASIESEEEMALLQAYIPNSYDIRALYVHGDIIGAIKRSSSDGFLNNVSAGGKAESIELTPEEIELAKRACSVLKRSFAGVDIVRTPSGPLLFEVNLGPQIYGFEAATGQDVPQELLTRIKKDFFAD